MVLKVTRRGSAALYLLLARSGRARTLPPLATTSTCASSPTIQARKFQAALAFLLSLEASDGGHPDICIRKRRVSHALKTGWHRHDADIALWEITGPGRSGLGLGIGHQRGAILNKAAA